MSIQQIQYNGQTYDIDAPEGTSPDDFLKYARQAEVEHLKQTSSHETDEEKRLKGESGFLSEATHRLTQAGNAIGDLTAPGREFDDNGVLLPKAYDATGHPTSPAGGRKMGDYVAAHPVREGANLALTAVPFALDAGLLGRTATRVAQTVQHPVAGGVIGGIEGYRRGGALGAVEGAAIGAAGGGVLGRIMRGGPKAAPVKAETPLLNADADALRTSLEASSGGTRRSPLDIAGGRSATPPVSESPRSQGESLLSPDAQAHAAALNVTGPKGPVSTSARDILTPQAQAMMDAMHKEANPVFRRMQAEGQFSGDRTTGPAPAGEPGDTSAIDAMRAIMGGERGPASVLDVGTQRGGGPIAQPTPPPNPNAGGRLAGRRMNPSTALEIALSGDPSGFQPGDTANVSLPEQVQPPVFMSPKAKAAAGQPQTQLASLEDAMRTREQSAAAQRHSPDLQVVNDGAPAQASVGGADATSMIDKLREGLKALPSHGEPAPAPVKTPSNVPKVKSTSASMDQQFKTLSTKAILTPEEASTLARLKTIMQGRASNIGLGHAARGK